MQTSIAEQQVKPTKRTARELLKGVKIVDADTHITEWPDLWTSRAPARFKDKMPQRKSAEGVTAWMIDDYEIARDYGYSAIKKDGSKVPGLDFFELKFHEVTDGAHDVAARLDYMDQNGFAAQIGYTNLLGFGGAKSMRVAPELREMAIQIQNDAMAELQANSGNRIYPMAMLPWWDLRASVKEAERCADMGLRGVNTHANPQDHGLPDLGEDHWTPLWELCEHRNLPVNFHVGFSQGQTGWESPGVWPSHDGYKKYAISNSMLFAPNMVVILNLLLSPVFERHPNLKFVSVESGVGWVPFMLENLDYQVKENLPGMTTSVLDLFREHFFICYWAEREGLVEIVRRVGANNVLFETDYPHPTCLYPDPLDYHLPSLEQLSASESRKVFGGNAEALYNLDLSNAPAAS
jgi:predicted TIM-barrel fold metal-dependent hydrolase